MEETGGRGVALELAARTLKNFEKEFWRKGCLARCFSVLEGVDLRELRVCRVAF